MGEKISPPEYRGQSKNELFLQRQRIVVVPITESEMRVLESRDSKEVVDYIMPKKPLGKLFNDFSVMTEGNLTRFAVQADGVELGYAMSGIYKEGGARVGEVAIVRVAPVVRKFGVGSILMNYGISTLVGEGVDKLRMHVADKTGRVETFSRKLGLEFVKDQSKGIGGQNKIFERMVSDTEQGFILDKAQTAYAMRMTTLAENQDLLSRVSQVVGADPLDVGFEDEVRQSHFLSNNMRPGSECDVVYAGHMGGRVRIALVQAGSQSDVVEAYVRGPNLNTARDLLGKKLNGFEIREEDFGLGEKFRGVVLQGKAGYRTEATKDLMPLASLSVTLAQRMEGQRYVGG